MVWKKILFIFNPVSGRSQIKNNLMEILEILSGADFKVVCYATKASGDARRIVREREDDYLYIVCAGGDGGTSPLSRSGICLPERRMILPQICIYLRI